MKKLFIILLLCGCSQEDVEPNVVGRYIGTDQNVWSVPLIIKTNEVIFNNVWIGDEYEIKGDSLFFTVYHNEVFWHFELRIIPEGLEGIHYRNNMSEPGARKQEGTFKFIKQ